MRAPKKRNRIASNRLEQLKARRPKQPDCTPHGQWLGDRANELFKGLTLKDGDLELNLEETPECKTVMLEALKTIARKRFKKQWEEWPDEDKKVYIERAQKVKDDYEEELLKWEESKDGQEFRELNGQRQNTKARAVS